MPRALKELAEYRIRQTPPLSCEDLANRLGVTRVTVWRWENGERSPDKEYAPEIARLTGLPIPEVLGFDAE